MLRALKTLALSSVGLLLLAAEPGLPPSPSLPSPVGPGALPIAKGKFQPTWESLKQYQAPEWFRDAKFGIWAHWGPQCQPEEGDWYARGMYEEGSGYYQSHLKRYGHPSQSGFKEVIREWKAEKWSPEKLVALYKRAGAKYFFALANHHDNFDLYDSTYQPWNSVNLGPKKDIIGGWAKAAKAQGLRFGVSVHAAHAWTWYETAQGADIKGDKAGLPYDGKLTKANGKGQWWEGLDPQALYAQNHARSESGKSSADQWDWGQGASIPDVAYCTKFFNRTVDLINKYQPDLIYFDDTALPLWPVSDAGLKLAAHFYNTNAARHGGQNQAVLFGKILDEEQQKCLVWDVERGVLPKTHPLPWQTDTCIGGWHYSRSTYESGYKSAGTVIRMLVDIVSKNGNLLLSVPVRGNGTLDEKELKVVEGITAWMDINQEAIFGTRPWAVFGEGPASEGAQISAQGFNEGQGKPLTAADVRFTTKGKALYVIALGEPKEALALKALGSKTGQPMKPIRHITVLGSPEKVHWRQGEDALVIQPLAAYPNPEAVVFKVTTD